MLPFFIHISLEEKKNHKIIFSVKTGCFSGASSMVANFFGSKVLKDWAKSLDIENIIIFGICWIVIIFKPAIKI